MKLLTAIVLGSSMLLSSGALADEPEREEQSDHAGED
jgi:hypothetical protein